MSTVISPRPSTSSARATEGGAQVADVFVIFGITGDLAKVMTFHSLYRLQQRGLLNCPIVGVAVSDWSHDDLRDHAHTAIEPCAGGPRHEAVFERLACGVSYGTGALRDAGPY